MTLYTVPQGQCVPAWFGKLPGMGDFAQRRFSPHFLELWDNWLQQGLQRLRTQHEDWLTHYLEAPLWYFSCGQKVLGTNPWIGVLMPSVDSVGRYFPLTLAIELENSFQLTAEECAVSRSCWWVCSANAALTALDTDLDAVRFDEYLQLEFSVTRNKVSTNLLAHELPETGMTSWHTNMAGNDTVFHSVRGLPMSASFDVLFGYSDLSAVQR